MQVNPRRAERNPLRIFTCFFDFLFLLLPQDAVKICAPYASAYVAIHEGVGGCGCGGLSQRGSLACRCGVWGMLGGSRIVQRVMEPFDRDVYIL